MNSNGLGFGGEGIGRFEEAGSDEIVTLSSSLTFLHKFGSLLFCIIVLAFIPLYALVSAHSPKGNFTILPLVAVAIFSYWSCARAKKVRLSGDVF